MGLKAMKPRGVERTGMYHADTEGGETSKADEDMKGKNDAVAKQEDAVDVESISDASGQKAGLVAREGDPARLLEKADGTMGGQIGIRCCGVADKV